MLGLFRSIPRNTLKTAVKAPVKPRAPRAPLAVPTAFLGRRYISVYGYTQAKALVYSKYGEPKDVLRLVLHIYMSNGGV